MVPRRGELFLVRLLRGGESRDRGPGKGQRGCLRVTLEETVRSDRVFRVESVVYLPEILIDLTGEDSNRSICRDSSSGANRSQRRYILIHQVDGHAVQILSRNHTGAKQTMRY